MENNLTKFALILTTIIIMGCKSKMEDNSLNEKFKCPESGTCSLTIHKGKKLELKKDNFNKMYYQLLEDEKRTTYLYVYQTKVDTTLPDSYYKEEIAFDLENNIKSLELKDESLKKINLLRSRMLFERGDNVGNFEVTNGSFSLNNNKVTINIETDKEFLLKNVSFDIKEK